MRSIGPAVAGVALALFVAVVPAAPASAGADPPDPIGAARDWLVAQQEDDGGFELADFPGFETPDAILAVATAAQTGSSWSTAEAKAAVDAVEVGGVTALDWADDVVDAGVSAGLEAKVALLVALPLGLDPAAFDPEGDGATDLTDALDTISPGLFNSFLIARILEAQLGRNVHQDDVQSICEAQQATGGWSFDAVPDGVNGADPDTTGFATMALAAAGVGSDDQVVDRAEGFFEANQDPTGVPPDVPAGGFFSFGSLDANATTLAVLGYSAAGLDPVALPSDPTPFLLSRQVTDPGPDLGRIVSPNDGFGITTFATSQTIQALQLLGGGASWLPRPGPGGRECLPAHTFADVASTAWNDDALRWLARFEVAKGYPDGSFRPREVFNRAQASLWFANVFPEVDSAPHPFPDVAPWFEAGADFVGDPAWPGGAIATGFPPDAEFRGTAPFTRGQAILWLYKAAGRPDAGALPAHGFTDGAPWFEDALRWATFHGLVAGFADGTFRPGQQINRGQGAYWFYNLAASPEAWSPAVTRPSTVVHSPGAP
jgi:hypothetical protein